MYETLTYDIKINEQTSSKILSIYVSSYFPFKDKIKHYSFYITREGKNGIKTALIKHVAMTFKMK